MGEAFTIHVLEKYEQMVPQVSDEDFNILKEDIRKNGQRLAIAVNINGRILDGHHRYRACCQLGLKIKYHVMEFPNEIEEELFVIDSNLIRRQLSDYQKGVLVLRKKPLYEKLAEMRQEASIPVKGQKGFQPVLGKVFPHTGKVDDQLAKEVQMSGKQLRKIERLSESDLLSDETKDKLIAGQVSINKAYGVIKTQERRTKTLEKVKNDSKMLSLPNKVNLLNIDAFSDQQLDGQVKDGSVDLIITDPPYSRDSIPLYHSLANFASRKLKDGGSLVFFFGQHLLPEVISIFSSQPDLTYWWMFAVKHEGHGSRFHSRGVWVEFKPMLWYVKGKKKLVDWDIHDYIESKMPDKEKHPWAQSRDEANYLIKNLTVSDDALVVDPFLGTGEFAIAALNLKRYFVGIEVDAKTYESSKKYIIEQSQQGST